jgi:hypothetical protein
MGCKFEEIWMKNRLCSGPTPHLRNCSKNNKKYKLCCMFGCLLVYSIVIIWCFLTSLTKYLNTHSHTHTQHTQTHLHNLLIEPVYLLNAIPPKKNQPNNYTLIKCPAKWYMNFCVFLITNKKKVKYQQVFFENWMFFHTHTLNTDTLQHTSIAQLKSRLIKSKKQIAQVDRDSLYIVVSSSPNFLNNYDVYFLYSHSHH